MACGPSAPKPRSLKTVIPPLLANPSVPLHIQLKACIEEALSRNVRTVPVRLEGKLVDVRLATLVHVRGESWCRRFRTGNSGKPQIAMRL